MTRISMLRRRKSLTSPPSLLLSYQVAQGNALLILAGLLWRVNSPKSLKIQELKGSCRKWSLQIKVWYLIVPPVPTGIATTRENTRSVTQAWAQAAALQKAQQARAKALAEQRQIEEASKASAAPQQRRKTFEPKIIQEPVSTPKVPKEEVVVKPAIPHELPKEVQVYYEKVEEAVLGMNGLIHNILEKSAREKEKKTGPPATTATQFEAFAEVKTKKTEWKDIFYSITSKNNKQIELFIAALQSLWQDPGLYKLLPYLIDFICKNVPKYVNNLGLLTSLMQIVSIIV